jgi:predicted  nucleic acid-binding Zn ribbon protein
MRIHGGETKGPRLWQTPAREPGKQRVFKLRHRWQACDVRAMAARTAIGCS